MTEKERVALHRLQLHRFRQACERELAYRTRCYPRWVKEGRMKQPMADEGIQVMQDIVVYFKRELAKIEPELPGIS